MAMSKEALEAVEAIRRDLKIDVRLERTSANFYDDASIRVTVDLTLAGEVIASSTDFTSLPQPRQD